MIQRLATEGGSQPVPESVPPAQPRKIRGIFTRGLLYTTIFGATFYAGSVVAALTNDRYYDFFVETAPFGEDVMDFAEAQGWDQTILSGVPKMAVDVTKTAYNSVAGAVSRTLGSGDASSTSAPSQESPPSHSVKSMAATVKGDIKDTSHQVTQTASTAAGKASRVADASTKNISAVQGAIKRKAYNWTSDIEALVKDAEAALKDDWKVPTLVPSKSESASSHPPGKKPFTGELPLGHTLPPGYYIPSESKPVESEGLKSSPTTPSLPLVAPAVSNFSASEPAIAQIASNIDSLARFLKESPNGTESVRDILEAAQTDLKKLGRRIDSVKVEEKKKLEEQLETQALEYSQKLLQLELDVQDKIDAQEEGYKVMLDDQREKIIQDYRQKLANELETQSQLINER